MPELPEVQTVVSQLGEKIVGKMLRSVRSDWFKAVRPSLNAFEKMAIGAIIVGTRRLGKHIVIDLNNGYSIVIHLKMTGHLLIKTGENREDEAFKDPYNQFIHHVITFSDDTTLEFSDMRKFGWMEAIPTNGVELLSGIASLGIDAMSDTLTPKLFGSMLDKKAKSAIGIVLLEQSLIAGIGNIYRSEALFRACILPDRLSGSLSKNERIRLLISIKNVLGAAIKLRGMSGGDFRDTNGKQGTFQKELGIYGRHGKPCPKCGTIIRRIKLGQRSTFFCPSCQL